MRSRVNETLAPTHTKKDESGEKESYQQRNKMSQKYTGFVLVIAAIALLAHAYWLTVNGKDERDAVIDAATVSVAVSQFDLAYGINRASTTAAEKSVSSTGAQLTKLFLYGEVAAALLLSVVGIAMIAGTALRTAQRVQVNASRPYASFDSCVFSGNDFAHFNHRGRALGRTDSAK